jgi:Domain of unknown function (DUF6429)
MLSRTLRAGCAGAGRHPGQHLCAALYLTLHDDNRAWKGFDWDVLGRLHDKGVIHDPVGKVKSVVFTDEGLERAKDLFKEMFER